MEQWKKWKESLSEDELIEVLEAFLYRDLETYFISSTYYCDYCIDEFEKNWPGICNWSNDFQRKSISITEFYHASRLQDSFEENEFNNLISKIECPNCGSTNYSYIWPYEITFDVPLNFEKYLEEIALLSEKNPFLILDHPFAKSVYNEIHELSKKINSSELEVPLYRARNYKRNKKFNKDDFLAPGKSIILEGRFNHAGRQVLYLAEDSSTCFQEIRKPEKGIMLSRIEISKKIKILNLFDEQFKGNKIIQAIRWSSLLSSPAEGEGYHKPHYVFTRFIADVALSAGFDAIHYPSVRKEYGKNIVIINYEEIENKVKVLDFEYYNEEN
ncbi:RES family NAD+ phosphorylase [Enterococcus sp. LJL98]